MERLKEKIILEEPEKVEIEEPEKIEIEEPVEELPQEGGADAGIASLLNSSIIDEFTTIDNYNSQIMTIKMLLEDEVLDLDEETIEAYQDIITILTDIVDEEHIHIGQLQKALELVSPSSSFIKDGELEATEVIDGEPIEDELEESFKNKYKDKPLTYEEARHLRLNEEVLHIPSGKTLYVMETPESVNHIWLSDKKGSEQGRTYYYKDLTKI